MERYIIGDVNTLPPLQQGELDSLCGLYAIINAIRITAYPQKTIKLRQASALMHDGLDYLDRKASLNTIIQEGISETLRLKLASHLVKQSEEHWGLKLSLTIGPKDHKQAVDFITTEIERHRPVTMCITGFYDHYTVIRGFSRTQFKLYDSDGLRAIYRRSISIEGDRRRTRFKLLGKKMFSVGVV